MAAAPDLGSGASRRGGSSPFIRTFTEPAFSGFFYAQEKGREVYPEFAEGSPFIHTHKAEMPNLTGWAFRSMTASSFVLQTNRLGFLLHDCVFSMVLPPGWVFLLLDSIFLVYNPPVGPFYFMGYNKQPILSFGRN